ncbi:MAG: FAD-dependent oxidoreductase [Myxococcota bacterium]
MHISRRAFVAGGLAASACARFQSAPKTPPHTDVLVLGAGIAGLSCARLLKRAGRRVRIIEASRRVGGRVKTHLSTHYPDVPIELGATRILHNHRHVRALVDELDLEYDCDTPPSSLRDMVFIDGKRMSHKEAFDTYIGEDEAERIRGSLTNYFHDHLGRIGDPFAPDWPSGLDSLDAMTRAEFLESVGASPEARRLLTLGHISGWSERLGALQSLRFYMVNEWSRRQKVRGGNEMLTLGLADQLRSELIRATPVRAIEVRPDRVRVVVEDSNGAQQSLEARNAVCTIPFSVLREIPITGLPDSVMSAIQTLDYVEVVRSALVFENRFWESAGLSGRVATDTGVQEIWNITPCSAHAQGIGVLAGYTTGKEARWIASLSPAVQLDTYQRELKRLLGLRIAPVEEFVSHAWQDDPWARGGWPTLGPGHGWMIDALRSDVGSLFFAGDHVSAYPGWMEGAVRSATEAADRILASSSVTA